ncbi:hypothetical protein CCACVL1_28164 [Corchorus capsularis]|uniref:Uncharacterized protein n=1 Tax=Corchorus capsularis TaxID=210143 RepID=A0A1R3G7E1_COCAP|nr:hypothetical protein CCACVL1_28164 [Corchorus capsularis]
MNALLDNCPALEELSVKRLCGIAEEAAVELRLGVVAASLNLVQELKSIFDPISSNRVLGAPISARARLLA